jgi:subtilisin family serine protease
MKRFTMILLVTIGILVAGSHQVRAGQQDDSKHIIVPGVGAGDCTLGMSKDELLKKLGEPEAIQFGENQAVRRGEEKYSLKDLPGECALCFGEVSFWIEDDSVSKISVRGPLYKLSNGLGVGDSDQNIKQAFKDFTAREGVGKENYLCYDAQGLRFAIDEKNQAATEIVVCRKREDPKAWKTLPKYNPDSPKPFQVDLRGRDLSQLDLRASLGDLMYADFDDSTVWPAPERMPAGFDWRKIMELGKNPGLGFRRLHQEGITGRGVRIAIIDQRLLVGHQEYADRLRFYEEIDLPSRWGPQMHGAAVASIALGKTAGVAPEAELYYIARPGGSPLPCLARCVHRIIEVNGQLPKENKIRVISMSTGWRPSDEGYKEMADAVQKAQATGMLVVCVGGPNLHERFTFGVLGRWPLADPDVFESYEPGLFRAKGFWSHPSSPSGSSFEVPMDSRTTASPGGTNEYVFYRIGGMSWAVPYIAGVYALAVQADPAMSPERFWALAVRTGRTIELNRQGMTKPLGPIIDPVRLIHAIQSGETATSTPEKRDNRNVQAPLQTNSATLTIVPGVRVGDHTLGMRKDEVLKRLGEPEAIELGNNQVIRRGEEKYRLKNLPSKCLFCFGDVSFWIEDDSVEAIRVRGPGYKFSNGLGVGDSEQKIRQAFGMASKREDAMRRPYLCYDDKGLGFVMHDTNRAAAEIVVYYPEGSRTAGPRVLRTLPKYEASDDPQAHLGGRDLSKFDLRASLQDLMYADFDDKTVWPAPDRMPAGFNGQRVLELGKNPGLGVRRLREKGITGRGVRVAIIDQCLLVGHQEYADRLRFYQEVDLGRIRPQMHGAAVASIALGKTLGVAPEAELYYIAMEFTDHNTLRRLARCVHKIIEVNAQLPKENKIRVISMSTGWRPSDEGYKEMVEAVQKAQAAGMLVVRVRGPNFDEGVHLGLLGRPPWADPDVFESYEPGLFLAKSFWAGQSWLSGSSFWVPMDSRTTASPDGIHEYVFYRTGGASWAVPYVAGVYALAVQADPAITPERFWALAARTGRTLQVNRQGMTKPLGPIVDPVSLIRAIQAGETATLMLERPDNQNVQAARQTNSETQIIVPGVRVGDHTLDLLAYEDVCGKDLRASELRYAGGILDTLKFNQETQWPPPERLPKGCDPKTLLQEGMNPGLGVRALHAQGINGSGVHVGLIDQPLLPDHPEYAGKIVSYQALDCGPHKTSAHSPGMASQLVGKRCGTAPGASLHVLAVPSWEMNASHYARALDRFVSYNEGAPKDQRIRVVSVSAQPSGEGSEYTNQSLWDEAVRRAQEKGILVLDCTWGHGFVSLCWLDPKNRESVEACTPGFRNGRVEVDEGHIHVPSAPRTAAEAGEDGSFGYAYDGGGRRSRRPRAKNGYSRAIPYAAGILALGWQVRPDLTPAQMKELLFASAYVHQSGARIIHPKAFIDVVKKQGKNQEPQRGATR